MNQSAKSCGEVAGLPAVPRETAAMPRDGCVVPVPAAGRGGPGQVHGKEARNGLCCELAVEVLRSSGRLRLRAWGASMLPAVWPGDILCIERQCAADAAPGDIVMIMRDGRLVTHRVVEKRDSRFATRDSGPNGIQNSKFKIQDPRLTIADSKFTIQDSEFKIQDSKFTFVIRGDRMTYNDAPVPGSQILGRVTAIQRGLRRFTPAPSAAHRLASWVLARSDFATRVVLSIRRRIQGRGFRFQALGRRAVEDGGGRMPLQLDREP